MPEVAHVRTRSPICSPIVVSPHPQIRAFSYSPTTLRPIILLLCHSCLQIFHFSYQSPHNCLGYLYEIQGKHNKAKLLWVFALPTLRLCIPVADSFAESQPRDIRLISYLQILIHLTFDRWPSVSGLTPPYAARLRYDPYTAG